MLLQRVHDFTVLAKDIWILLLLVFIDYLLLNVVFCVLKAKRASIFPVWTTFLAANFALIQIYHARLMLGLKFW